MVTEENKVRENCPYARLPKHYAMKCEEWMYKSIFSLPRHFLEAIGQLQTLPFLVPEETALSTH
jgi:hypothetical protein